MISIKNSVSQDSNISLLKNLRCASAFSFFTKPAKTRKKELLQVQLCNTDYTKNVTFSCWKKCNILYAFENVPPITDLWEDEEDAFPLLGYSTHTSRKVSVIGKEGTIYDMNALMQFFHQSMRQRATDRKIITMYWGNTTNKWKFTIFLWHIFH